MDSGRRSDLAAVALAALTVAAGLGFDRVFATGGWLVPVVGAAALPFLVGALARRRRWSAAHTAMLSLVALALYLVWVIEPATTTFGLPRTGTLDALRDDAREGWDVLRNSRAPIAVTDGALLLAVLASWTTGLVADFLAFRRHATIGAVMPPLVLFVTTAALGTDAGRLRWTLAFALAAVAFLLLQHQALLERGRARFAGRRIASGAGFALVGVAAGVAAVLGGMVVAPALPGAGDDAVLDYRGLVDDDSTVYRTVTPIAGVRSTLLRPEEELLFTVRSPQREYWRIAGLDEFDGDVWKLSSTDDDISEGLDDDAGASEIVQEFEIGPLGERWMPAAFVPTRVEGADVLVVEETATLVTAGDSVSGIDYRVTSRVPPTALNPDQRDEAAGTIPDDIARYLELPDDFPDAVRAEAGRATAGLTNPYDRAVALDEYFESGFVYDLSVDYGHSDEAMQDFLAARRGFCEQFASTYAAMARAVGLPARVAVGFTPGTETAPGVFEVTTHDAHAWPEVWINGVGWMRFEATPPSPEPGGADGDSAALPGGGAEAPGTESGAPATTSPPVTTAPPAPEAEIEIESPAIDAPADDGDPLDVGWWAVAAAGALVGGGAVAYLLIVPGAKARRRARRRADPDPARAVRSAWADTLERLDEAGIHRPRAATPLEAAQAAVTTAPVAAREPLRSLAVTFTETEYSPRAPDTDDARAAWAGADDVRAALAEGVGVLTRLRRQLDPSALRRG